MLVFMNDILIYSKMVHIYKEDLRPIFYLLRSCKFYAKWSKCQIFSLYVEHIGLIILDKGMLVNIKKGESNYSGGDT